MRTLKFLFSLILISFTDSLFAQGFAPIGAEWYYSSSAGGAAPTRSEYYHLVVTKDTSINEYDLRKIERTYYRYRGDSIKVTPYFIYQTGDTVSLYNPDLDKFYKFLIFNVSQGDTLTLDVPYENYHLEDTSYRVVIDTVVTEIYDNTELKKYILDQIDEFGWFEGFYLEKVGGYEWFLPLGLYIIPEEDGPIRCYHDNDIDINFSGPDCDYRRINSVNSLYDNVFKIYPNPTNGLIQIESDLEIDRIIIIDTEGKILFESTTTIIDFNNLDKGTYYINIHSNNNVIIKKIIKN